MGDRVELSPTVKFPGILQLSFGKTYEVVSVGRANNPANDNIYVQNDHGRVTPYFARLFSKVDEWIVVSTDRGLFLGVPMAYTNPDGQTIAIVALPDYPTEVDTELAGVVAIDETGYWGDEGTFVRWFSRELFSEIR